MEAGNGLESAGYLSVFLNFPVKKLQWAVGMNLLMLFTHSLYTTFRIQAISLVESYDLLDDRRTELRHTNVNCFGFYIKMPKIF